MCPCQPCSSLVCRGHQHLGGSQSVNGSSRGMRDSGALQTLGCMWTLGVVYSVHMEAGRLDSVRPFGSMAAGLEAWLQAWRRCCTLGCMRGCMQDHPARPHVRATRQHAATPDAGPEAWAAAAHLRYYGNAMHGDASMYPCMTQRPTLSEAKEGKRFRTACDRECDHQAQKHSPPPPAACGCCIKCSSAHGTAAGPKGPCIHHAPTAFKML